MFVDEKAVGEPQPVKVGTLKLSTAIRIGASKRPQCAVAMFKGGASCALGAAYEAVYGHPGMDATMSDYIGKDMALHWVQLAFPKMNGLMEFGIWSRNDRGVSREAIADWLESQGY